MSPAILIGHRDVGTTVKIGDEPVFLLGVREDGTSVIAGTIGQKIVKTSDLRHATPLVDKAKLWDAMKSELEKESLGKAPKVYSPNGYTETEESVSARSMLDRMIQAETLAMVKEVRL